MSSSSFHQDQQQDNQNPYYLKEDQEDNDYATARMTTPVPFQQLQETYQQQQTSNDNHNHNPQQQVIHHQQQQDDEEEEESVWAFADFGRVGPYSRDGSPHATDEVFNAASHLAAAMLSVLGTALLITDAAAAQQPNGGGDAWKVVSFSIYGASLIFLFSCSTLHHGIVGRFENLFRMMDYLAIYPLIAGTFTPLCLVLFHDSTTGWIFFSTVWGIAAAGMLMTAVWFVKIPKWLSMTLYITLGWLGACMAPWLYPVLGAGGFTLLAVGGILYTLGGYVFMTEQPNPLPGRFGFHEIWHVAVIAAAFSHWLLMYLYVLPYQKTSTTTEYSNSNQSNDDERI